MDATKMLEKFKEVFGDAQGCKQYFAPGRVNLIGEHTDYNGGYVFPCALTIGTYAAARKRNDGKMRFYSLNFENLGIIESDISKLENVKEDDWANYPKGVVWAFKEKGMAIPSGFDLLLYGNIPNGSGLSSSASVEVLTGFILKDMFGFNVDNVELAKIGQFSENKFNGVNCGIMDQFAVAMGKKNQAICLNTNTLEYEYAPVAMDNLKLVIASSNKKRGLGDSKYNERRAECEKAVEMLKAGVSGIKALCEIDVETFEKNKRFITDETIYRRAKHAVTENERTKAAVEALKKNDMATFGKLMNESHKSLKEDYEVTGVELDTLAETAQAQKGVLGSRMTGAGFGGCTVSLVEENAIDDFIKNVGEAYEKKIGYKADFYVVSAGEGPQIISD